MSTEPKTIRKTTHDLAVLIASNVAAAGLSGKVEEYFLENKGDIRAAIRRGFILQPPEQNLDWWIAKAEEFAALRLGVRVDLRKKFDIPTKFPWQRVIPVFDPGLTNRQMVKKALQGHNINVWEETDVNEYSGSVANAKPSLWFIENSVSPNSDTMNLSPGYLRATGKSFISLRGYGLAFAVHYYATGECLDTETFTLFPENCLPDERIADAHSIGAGVKFRKHHPLSCSDVGGARVAIQAPLKS